jgi:Fe2+ or Zn2+ uptake regulation protein
LQKDVCKEHSFTLQNASLQIFGTCSKCRSKSAHPRKQRT